MPRSGWFDIGGGESDYHFGGEPGAVARESSFSLDGSEYPCRILSSLAVYIQLDDAAATAFLGEAPPSTLFRRVGVGRVRKNLSTPLQAPADRIWIHALNGDAVLGVRRDRGTEHTAFIRLGALSSAVLIMGRTIGRVVVEFVLADDFLPDASSRHLRRLVEEHRAWGAQVACTTEA